ncbi:hypothetical protein ACRAWG_14175 [Methylobacterium sp. P31]
MIGAAVAKMIRPTISTAATVLGKPAVSASVPPIASKARNEIDPRAVCATSRLDQRRAFLAVKRRA